MIFGAGGNREKKHFLRPFSVGKKFGGHSPGNKIQKARPPRVGVWGGVCGGGGGRVFVWCGVLW